MLLNVWSINDGNQSDTLDRIVEITLISFVYEVFNSKFEWVPVHAKKQIVFESASKSVVHLVCSVSLIYITRVQLVVLVRQLSSVVCVSKQSQRIASLRLFQFLAVSTLSLNSYISSYLPWVFLSCSPATPFLQLLLMQSSSLLHT